MLPSARLHIAGERKRSRWDQVRLVMPIGVIVVVAIVCVIGAVLTSARRADQVAFENEQRLISAVARRARSACTASGRKRRRDAERYREDPQRLRSAMGRTTHRPMAREIPFRRRNDRRRRRPHRIPVSGRRRAGRERLCRRTCAEHRPAARAACRNAGACGRLARRPGPGQSGPQHGRRPAIPRQTRLYRRGGGRRRLRSRGGQRPPPRSCWP